MPDAPLQEKKRSRSKIWTPTKGVLAKLKGFLSSCGKAFSEMERGAGRLAEKAGGEKSSVKTELTALKAAPSGQEHGVYAEESSPGEYASDRFSSGVDSVSHEAVHQFDKQGRKGVQTTKENISKVKENIQKRKAAAEQPKKTSGEAGGPADRYCHRQSCQSCGPCRSCSSHCHSSRHQGGGQSHRRSGEGHHCGDKGIDCGHRSRGMDCGTGGYRDLSDRYDNRFLLWYFLLR